jgi:hypothetical protein
MRGPGPGRLTCPPTSLARNSKVPGLGVCLCLSSHSGPARGRPRPDQSGPARGSGHSGPARARPDVPDEDSGSASQLDSGSPWSSAVSTRGIGTQRLGVGMADPIQSLPT